MGLLLLSAATIMQFAVKLYQCDISRIYIIDQAQKLEELTDDGHI